jgi:hypothetical protein
MTDFFSLESKASIYTTKQPIPAMIYQMGARTDHKVSDRPLVIIALPIPLNSILNAHRNPTLVYF